MDEVMVDCCCLDNDADHTTLPLPLPPTTFPRPLPPRSCCWTMTEMTGPALPSCPRPTTCCWTPRLTTCWMVPLLCCLSLVPGSVAAEVLPAVGGAYCGHAADLTLLALCWATAGGSDFATLKTSGADDVLGVSPSVGVAATVAEFGETQLALLAQEEAALRIPLLQEDVKKISTQLEAVQTLSWLLMDAALYEAKKLSMMKQERIKLMTRQQVFTDTQKGVCKAIFFLLNTDGVC